MQFIIFRHNNLNFIRKPMKAPKQLNITLTDDEQSVLTEVWEQTGNKPQSLMHSLLMALKYQWESERQIVMPLRLAGARETPPADDKAEVVTATAKKAQATAKK
jgi:hypothetical protein